MKQIAIEMGRSRTSIRDKLRALLSLGDGKERYVGTWSKSDDRKLIEIVNSLLHLSMLPLTVDLICLELIPFAFFFNPGGTIEERDGT